MKRKKPSFPVLGQPPAAEPRASHRHPASPLCEMGQPTFSCPQPRVFVRVAVSPTRSWASHLSPHRLRRALLLHLPLPGSLLSRYWRVSPKTDLSVVLPRSETPPLSTERSPVCLSLRLWPFTLAGFVGLLTVFRNNSR